MVDELDIALTKFGDQLRKVRLSQSLSQEQLAFETGLSREYVNKIENGKVNISLKNVIAIAKVLGMPTKELIPF